MDILNGLIAGLRSPKTLIGGILSSVALVAYALMKELEEPGFDYAMWALVVAAFGQFLTGLFGRDANVSSRQTMGIDLEPPKV